MSEKTYCLTGANLLMRNFNTSVGETKRATIEFPLAVNVYPLADEENAAKSLFSAFSKVKNPNRFPSNLKAYATIHSKCYINPVDVSGLVRRACSQIQDSLTFKQDLAIEVNRKFQHSTKSKLEITLLWSEKTLDQIIERSKAQERYK